MALSGIFNYALTRDTLIARALRIVGAISQGETPTATAVTEASQTLNEILKEWQTDGMQLWVRNTITLNGGVALTTGATITISYATVAVSNANTPAPVKAPQTIWFRRTADSVDFPLTLITKSEYDQLTPKLTTGTPTLVCYEPPGATSAAAAQQGTFYFYPALSTAWIAANVVYATVEQPFQIFNASTDNPDLPDYLYNALTWGLADQLSYEYGVGLAERSMITKKAQTHKAIAMSFDVEEGSLWIRPDPQQDAV